MKKGCLIILIIFIINLTIGGFATEYIVEFWGSVVKEQPVDVPFAPCVVAGLFLGEATIPLAALTWILSFVVDRPTK